ncbi:MAG: U32 family peptidase [Rhodospirillales bacterium]|nr:U32 family peptidase [Rhodospirillales bacterium]MBO6788380.1 U32 family peptidase [Rhodospirillales bacterium]
MSKEDAARLAFGPVLFNWAPERWRDFYFHIADEAPVDTVYLGEVVCAKRAPFIAPHLPTVIERLQAAGKEVVLSTLALIMDRRDAALVQDVIDAADGLLVEANDISAVALLAGRPHVIGPFVNVYNEGTLQYLQANGAERVCLPVELPGRSIGHLAAGDAEIEVFAFGRLPLAISARCYHARHHGLSKDGCQFVCDRDADGLDLETLDGQSFLALNGVQTLSHSCANLIGELDTMRGQGIRRFRLSPHSGDMAAVARAFRSVLDGDADPVDANEVIQAQVGAMPMSNGYFFGEEGYRLRGLLANAAE